MKYVWKNNSGFNHSTFTGDANKATALGYVAIADEQYDLLVKHKLHWQNGELVPCEEVKPDGIIFGAEHSARVTRIISEFAQIGLTVKAVNERNFAETNTDNLKFVLWANAMQAEKLAQIKPNVKFFNKPTATLNAKDKLYTYKILMENDIAQPQTFTSFDSATYPIVVKGRCGSLGNQVYLATNASELCRAEEKLKNVAHIYQQFVANSSGRDMRVICIGGNAFAWYVRQNPNDFRSNLAQGGNGTACALPQNFKETCEKTARVLDLDFCGIDVLFGENNEPLICEVNGNPMVAGAERITGKNVIAEFANYVAQHI